MKAFMLIILHFLFTLAISFFLVTGAYWIICWAFTLVFSWKCALAIFVAITIIRGTISIVFKKNND